MFETIDQRLINGGLVLPDQAVLGRFQDREKPEWNRSCRHHSVLESVLSTTGIGAVIFARPAPPYDILIDHLAEASDGIVRPGDCETHAILHDLPVCRDFRFDLLLPWIRKRRSILIPGQGILATGPDCLEQAYIAFASTCFACFVAFFSGLLEAARHHGLADKQKLVFESIEEQLPPELSHTVTLKTGPWNTKAEVMAAMDEAGKQVVAHRLIDSNFGNISARLANTVYISATGVSLDNLPGHIIGCDRHTGTLDTTGNCCRPSSDLPVHLAIARSTDYHAVLHGHPKFTVIMSMDCEDQANCNGAGNCHLQCSKPRQVCGIPVVSGQVGSGQYGLYRTVPPAIKDAPGVIVYGHGLFTAGETDFNEPFYNLIQIENACRQACLETIRKYL